MLVGSRSCDKGPSRKWIHSSIEWKELISLKKSCKKTFDRYWCRIGCVARVPQQQFGELSCPRSRLSMPKIISTVNCRAKFRPYPHFLQKSELSKFINVDDRVRDPGGDENLSINTLIRINQKTIFSLLNWVLKNKRGNKTDYLRVWETQIDWK